MTEAAVSLSVIVPTFDEAPRLEKTLDEIGRFLSGKGVRHEIIVVDDGSRDATGEIAARCARKSPDVRVLTNDVNRGKGYSVRRGMLEARGERVLFTDADLSAPIEETEKLLRALDEGYDVAIGSRGVRESRIERRQPPYREFMGLIFSLLVRLVAFRGVADTQCGFKCFTRGAARDVFGKSVIDGYCFDVEALWLARRQGLRVKEVGVVWRNSDHSHVRPLVDAYRMFWDLLALRRRFLRGA